jgi:hypothetical protein
VRRRAHSAVTRLTDPHDGTTVNLAEPRIKAGVLLAAPGKAMMPSASQTAEKYPFFSTIDIPAMTAHSLVAGGGFEPPTFGL